MGWIGLAIYVSVDEASPFCFRRGGRVIDFSFMRGRFVYFSFMEASSFNVPSWKVASIENARRLVYR